MSRKHRSSSVGAGARHMSTSLPSAAAALPGMPRASLDLPLLRLLPSLAEADMVRGVGPPPLPAEERALSKRSILISGKAAPSAPALGGKAGAATPALAERSNLMREAAAAATSEPGAATALGVGGGGSIKPAACGGGGTMASALRMRVPPAAMGGPGDGRGVGAGVAGGMRNPCCSPRRRALGRRNSSTSVVTAYTFWPLRRLSRSM
mmetsp:Transcript_19927/g.63357  ORF Transcript_19927/g.63357 Transcript_19927/m.63357 type:complete len:208 (-) Transcript_19927:652-1275(-)